MATATHLREGTVLQGGKYRITRFIGQGGFGCTYEAEHTLFASRVAIKEFFAKDFCNRDAATGSVTVATESRREVLTTLRRKFVDEARVVFNLRHENIVRVLDIFEENGTAYYVMDYIDGQSLRDLLATRGALPEAEAVGYIRQVAAAIAYVHSRHRLHLDIKPGNIMIDTSGRALLIDFGTSKHYDESSGEDTSTLVGVNTPGFAPVEQMNASFSSFNPEADIYALGATLYKCLSGLTPPSAVALLSEEETLLPLPLAVTARTRAAVAAAMQLKRKDRPHSVAAFLSLLGGSTSDEETVLDTPPPHIDPPLPPTKKTTPPSPPTMTDSPLRKGLRGCAGIIGVILLLLCVVGQIAYGIYHRTNPTSTGEEEVVVVPDTGTINGHEWVDLGLSVKWATCNVGATSPEEYGDYFAWGEINPKDTYTEENSVSYKKEMFGSIAGSATYDAARANLGGTWRLPTKEEIDELVDNCKHELAEINGVWGYKVTGPSGNSIFLPAAGYRVGSSLDSAGDAGSCWSATPDEDDTDRAYALFFNSGGVFYSNGVGRFYGLPVRPVFRIKRSVISL